VQAYCSTSCAAPLVQLYQTVSLWYKYFVSFIRALNKIHSTWYSCFRASWYNIRKWPTRWQQCRIIYYSLAALHVSSGIFAHNQEHLNCIAASGITHVCRCRLVSWEQPRNNKWSHTVASCWSFSYIIYSTVEQFKSQFFLRSWQFLS